jgi:hypothetical protein
MNELAVFLQLSFNTATIAGPVVSSLTIAYYLHGTTSSRDLWSFLGNTKSPMKVEKHNRVAYPTAPIEREYL